MQREMDVKRCSAEEGNHIMMGEAMQREMDVKRRLEEEDEAIVARSLRQRMEAGHWTEEIIHRRTYVPVQVKASPFAPT